MRRSDYTVEQIVQILGQGEAEGVAQACRSHRINQSTYFRWKLRFAGLSLSQARAMQALGEENRRLRRAVDGLNADLRALQTILAEGLETSAREGCVQELCARFQLSERHACRLVGLSRSLLRYRAGRSKRAQRPWPVGSSATAS